MPELVAVEGPPGPAWLDELRRRWDAGDAVLPVDHRLPPPAVEALLQALRPTRRTVAGSGHDRPCVDGRGVEEGDAVVLSTSGTTGAPKGVVLTHGAIEASARATSAALDVDPGADAWVACLPLAHAGGLGVVTRALVTGTPVEVLAAFDPDEVLARTERFSASGRRVLTSLVATALRRIDVSVFGAVLLGGDAPPSWPGGRPRGIVVTYGMTETGGGCVYDGRPLAGIEVKVEAGEVHLRGPVLGRAYRDSTGERPLAGAGGWLATGDGGRLDTDGRLVVDGRISDVIVTGGEKVWPQPVEQVIRACRGVADVAVVGRPDDEWGQRVVAVVVAEPGRSPSLVELRQAVRDVLPAYAAPKEVELVDQLPKTALGKVRRGALRPTPHA